MTPLDRLLAASADPAGAAVRVEAALEAADPPVRDSIRRDAAAAGRLVALCDASPALAETLRADPDLTRFLALPDAEAAPDAAAIGAEVDALPGGAEERLSALRRLRRREAVRSALRHLGDAAPIEVLAAEISAVADVAVRAVLGLVEEGLRARYGAPGPPFAVIALGKWGAEELNFRSDIDVLFVAEADTESPALLERAARLAERTVATLSAPAPEGLLYHVDTRLRPDGRSGPLTRSVDSFLRYYQESGATWERQALIKARFVAGEAALAETFLRAVEPFVWRKYLDRDSIDAIEEIKGKIEARVEDESERDVKLGFGGIREIEFIVQILQLANGGRDPRVRSRSTIGALDSLVDTRRLLADDAAPLAVAYRFLRRVEHLLQIEADAPRRILPESPEALGRLARFLGLPDSEAFLEQYRTTTRGVRAAYERLFSQADRMALAAEEWRLADALDAAEVGADDGHEGARERIRRLGFADPEGSLASFRSLARGTALDMRTSAIRRQFLRLSADLLPRVRATPDPDRTVRCLARLVEAYGARAPLYDVLAARPAVLDLFVRVAGLSALLVEALSADPSNIESLLAPASLAFERPPEELPGRYGHLVAQGGEEIALSSLVFEERLRIGLRHLLGLDSPEAVCRALAGLADAVLRIALGGGDSGGLAVLAAGKLGARDLRYLSDLDLVFVAGKGADIEAATARVRALLDRLGRGRLFEVDARLRPWGRSAPLVVSLPEFRRYIDEAAEPWERLVWARGRAVAGSADVGAAALEALRGLLDRSFDPEARSAVRTIRARLLAEAPGGEADPKRGLGGTMEAEFVSAHRAATGTALPPGVAEAKRFYRRLELAVQSATGGAWTSMPEGRDAAVVARLAGAEPDALAAEREVHRAAVRAAFTETFGE